MTRGLAIRRTPPMGMVAIDPATFEVGSNEPNQTPDFHSSSQKPVHAATVSDPFRMGAHEVIRAEHPSVKGSNPSFQVGPNRGFRVVLAPLLAP